MFNYANCVYKSSLNCVLKVNSKKKKKKPFKISKCERDKKFHATIKSFIIVKI